MTSFFGFSNHEAEVLFAWNTCFPLNPPTKVERTGFGYASAFFLSQPLIQSPISNFVYEILRACLPITIPRSRLHSDVIFISFPLTISIALLWICSCTLKYDSEGFRKYPYRGLVYCSMSHIALIFPTVSEL